MVELRKEMRAVIQRIGGTMPEDISPVEHIKQVEKRLKSSPPKLKLEDKEANGLVGNKKKDNEKDQA